jgi:hypothetical protein
VDSFSSENEVKIGTDPGWPCAIINGHDAWPRDFDYNHVVNITDLTQLLPPFFGSAAGSSNFTMRRNLDPSNNVINITDLTNLLPPFFGSSCDSPTIKCEVKVVGATVDTSKCAGGTLSGPASNILTGAGLTISFAGVCTPAAPVGNDTVGVFAKLFRTAADGDQVNEAQARCTSGTPITGALAPNALPLVVNGNNGTAQASADGDTNFECRMRATDAGTANIKARFVCWGAFRN